MAAGHSGLLGMEILEEFGGRDFRFNAVIPDEQKEQWLHGTGSGELVTATGRCSRG